MMSDSAAGVMSAAPRPCAARAAMSSLAPPAKPDISEAVVNTAMPARKTRRRGSKVGDAAAEQQPPAGGKQVRGDEPRQVAAGQVQRPADARQGGIDDTDVEDDEDLGDE